MIKIRSHDSIIIPLMVEENRARFITVSLRVPFEQGLLQGYKGLIVISLAYELLKEEKTDKAMDTQKTN